MGKRVLILDQIFGSGCTSSSFAKLVPEYQSVVGFPTSGFISNTWLDFTPVTLSKAAYLWLPI